MIPPWFKTFTRLRLQVSHLKEQKIRHGFGDIISHMRGRNAEFENTKHFHLRCRFCSTQRFELFNDINEVDLSFKRPFVYL